MDNHQEELARALKEKHYLEYCLPKVGIYTDILKIIPFLRI